MLKDLQKFVKVHHVLALAGLVLLVAVVMQYSNRKGSALDGMEPNKRPSSRQAVADSSVEGVEHHKDMDYHQVALVNQL